MAAWFNFCLQALRDLVSTIFSLDLGLGFSLGDMDVALLLIGIVGSALVVKVATRATRMVSRDEY